MRGEGRKDVSVLIVKAKRKKHLIEYLGLLLRALFVNG